MTQDDSKMFYTHLQDQKDAAVDEAGSLMNKFLKASSEILGEPCEKVDVADFSETYVGQKFKWMTSLEEFKKVTIRGCLHVDLKSPSVYYVNMFHPKAVGCIPCTHDIAVNFYKEFPFVCDFCFGKHLLYNEVVVRVGAFIIIGNLCESCFSSHIASHTA
jgi:hypothetical protein